MKLGSTIHALAVARAAYRRTRVDDGQHVRDALGAVFDITGPFEARAMFDIPRHGHAVVCPHAAVEYKEWPNERWAELLAYLPEDTIVCPAPGRNLPWRRDAQLDIFDLARTIAGARLFIGVDSGPIHLADLFGVPAIGLYAATSTATYGPYTDRSLCVDKHREAWAATKTVAYHSPTHVYPGAMMHITVEDVMQKVRACG